MRNSASDKHKVNYLHVVSRVCVFPSRHLAIKQEEVSKTVHCSFGNDCPNQTISGLKQTNHLDALMCTFLGNQKPDWVPLCCTS